MEFTLESIPVNLEKFNPANVEKEARRVIKATKNTASGEALQILLRHQKTTKTWRHKPGWHFKVTETSTGIEIRVWTDDEIYMWVNDGTSVRYAKLSSDWESKTHPGVIGSGPGAGRVLVVSRNWPQPGIIPRHFTETILQERESVAIRHIQERFNREAQTMFGGA